MGLKRSERAADLRELYGAVWVESPAEMASRMTPEQRARLGRLWSEQLFLLDRGKPSPRLDPELVADAVYEVERCVAGARANRRLMRRALGLSEAEPEVSGAMHVLSLCSGIGGLDIGLKSAVPATVIAYVEGERSCQEVLLARMADGVLDWAPIYGNITSFDCAPWRGLVDCVVGGYPCPPFSTAGKRRGADDPRYLWSHVARIVGAVAPEWCLFENVAGHLSLGAADVVRGLVGVGFRVAMGLFTASELGAPHERERLFILGHRDALGPAPVRLREPVADGPGGGRAGVQGVGGGAEAARGEEALPAAPGVAAVVHPGLPAADVRAGGGRQRLGLRQPRWEIWRRRWGYPGLWPPRPRGNWQAWRGVRATDPSLMPRAKEGLNPAFVEWKMGFPRGWTEGIPRPARLRMLGNAVVPAVAALAWRELSAAILEDTARGPGYTR